MIELWTRAKLMEALRLKDPDSITSLERKGLPFLVLGNRKRYRPEAVDLFIQELEQTSKQKRNRN
jgi:hypothetical protein